MGTDSTGGGGTGSSFAATLRSLLLGSVPRVVGTGALALVVAVGVAFAAGFLGVPAVNEFQNEFTDVNDSTTTIGSTIEVTNPNPVGASFLGVSGEYAIAMNDVRMANGSTGAIAMAPGNSTIDLETALDNDRIPDWWVSHVPNGEQTTVNVNATVDSDLLGRSVPVTQTRSIETDMLSSFNSTETRSVNSSSPLVSDPVLYVNETRAQWGEVTQERTGIVVDFYIYNPKDYAVPVSKLNYTIEMNEVRVGAGENTDEKVLEPNSLTRVRTVTYIRNENLDDWWVTHVERNQRTEVVIDFAASVEVAGTELDIPLEGMTHRETIETDVFGTKGGGAPGNETDDDGSDADGSDDGSNDEATGGEDTTTAGEDATTDDDGSTTNDDDGTTTDDGGVLPALARTLASTGTASTTSQSTRRVR
ncbi:LEA type 2 family protein [Halorubellus sp. PRR65]|uniref:LEA type 2 family protein n=1 Tax=Halorubellus sp. PRR65 TaxID=3098148 RepID=UPI002B2596B6|nr:LEA type 2 family protein [Halorubellus sp. PRR65]